MTISVGDKVPSTTLYKMGTDGPEAVRRMTVARATGCDFRRAERYANLLG